MEVEKQEQLQEFMCTLPDVQLTESGSLEDTSNAVISPLFVITPSDVDETGQPSAAVIVLIL